MSESLPVRLLQLPEESDYFKATQSVARSLKHANTPGDIELELRKQLVDYSTSPDYDMQDHLDHVKRLGRRLNPFTRALGSQSTIESSAFSRIFARGSLAGVAITRIVYDDTMPFDELAGDLTNQNPSDNKVERYTEDQISRGITFLGNPSVKIITKIAEWGVEPEQQLFKNIFLMGCGFVVANAYDYHQSRLTYDPSMLELLVKVSDQSSESTYDWSRSASVELFNETEG